MATRHVQHLGAGRERLLEHLPTLVVAPATPPLHTRVHRDLPHRPLLSARSRALPSLVIKAVPNPPARRPSPDGYPAPLVNSRRLPRVGRRGRCRDGGNEPSWRNAGGGESGGERQSARPAGFVGQLEGSPVDSERVGCFNVAEDADGFGRVDVLRGHEPARLVRADRDPRHVGRAETLAHLPEDRPSL